MSRVTIHMSNWPLLKSNFLGQATSREQNLGRWSIWLWGGPQTFIILVILCSLGFLDWPMYSSLLAVGMHFSQGGSQVKASKLLIYTLAVHSSNGLLGWAVCWSVTDKGNECTGPQCLNQAGNNPYDMFCGGSQTLYSIGQVVPVLPWFARSQLVPDAV